MQEGARRSGDALPLDLTVVNAGIKQPEGDREDHPEDPIEGVPRDDQPQHGVAGLVDPIQIAVCRVFSHKQHDHGMTVERWDRKQVKCAEEQVQNEQDAQSGSTKGRVTGMR